MKKFVFVLMPFDSVFNDIYKLGIKNTCEELDMYCERVDEQHYEGNMLERIYNQINKADYLIADLTGQNPNVYYELGYAHALSKKVVLITQNADEIPFDMKQYRHFIYSANQIALLKDELKNRFKWYLENDVIHEKIDMPIEVFVNGIKLKEGENVKIPIELSVSKGIYDVLDGYSGKVSAAFYNPTSEVVDFRNGGNSFDFISPVVLPFEDYGIYEIAEQMQLFKIFFDDTMFPKQWCGHGMEIRFHSDKTDAKEIIEQEYPCKMIFVRSYTPKEFDFTIVFNMADK